MDTVRGIGKHLLGEIAAPAPSYYRLVVRMCCRADAVVCTTVEQQELIAPHCRNVHTILDIHDDEVRAVKSDYATGDTLNLFWEGLPYTLPDFRLLSGALRALGTERRLAVHVMTNLSFGRLGGRLRKAQTRDVLDRLFDGAYLYQWNAEMLSTLATACDLAVIPLDLTHPLARGKPENKLLLMWRMGLPVIASATPAYTRAMAAAGVDGVCASAAQWSQSLRRFAQDEALRREAGQRGRAYAQRECDREALLARWDRVLDSVGVTSGSG
ncbi:MAG: hypothetical protein DLM64_09730 [Solirubrobacterales bacterium]|nr:MAG: hypothetical protein DLM64_09730 [Solirubrobacterales bacterium]